MRILFDHSTPALLRHALTSHTVVEAIQLGWDKLGNGALLDAAETAAFDILVTADNNMRHQQNLTGRKIAIVVLGNAQWPVLRPHVDSVVVALNEAVAGRVTLIQIPPK